MQMAISAGNNLEPETDEDRVPLLSAAVSSPLAYPQCQAGLMGPNLSPPTSPFFLS